MEYALHLARELKENALCLARNLLLTQRQWKTASTWPFFFRGNLLERQVGQCSSCRSSSLMCAPCRSSSLMYPSYRSRSLMYASCRSNSLMRSSCTGSIPWCMYLATAVPYCAHVRCEFEDQDIKKAPQCGAFFAGRRRLLRRALDCER